MNQTISFPIDLAGMYQSTKQVERMELILEAFGGLTKFFNIYCAKPIEQLINTDMLDDYLVGVNNKDDDLVFSRVVDCCRRNERREEEIFTDHHLDNLGVTISELRTQIKASAIYLIECALDIVSEHIQGEARDNGGRFDSLATLSAHSELLAERDLPITLILEAEIVIDLI